jgi:hypothetical protein
MRIKLNLIKNLSNQRNANAKFKGVKNEADVGARLDSTVLSKIASLGKSLMTTTINSSV